MKNIRDPLYGFITANEMELRVISTPPVQRLRRVAHLGLSDAVYPSATHSRFEHSLGVMHLAGELAASLGLPEDEVQAYKIAGLLHDVGHSPFSHALEEVIEERLGFEHERQSERVIRELEDRYDPDPEFVIDIIHGRTKYDIVAGDIDADRLDYLQRDARRTGFQNSSVDVQTIVKFAQIRDEQIVFDKKAVQAIEDMFAARLRMMKTIAGHHATRIAEAMLRRAVDGLLDDTSYTAEDVLTWDDYQLHTHLLEYEGHENLPERGSDRLYTRIANRDLYKRAVYVNENTIGRDTVREIATEHDDPTRIEERIATEAGVHPHHVIVDLPSLPSEASTNVRIAMPEGIRDFSDISPTPSHLVDVQRRNTTLGVYSPRSDVDAVRSAAQEYFAL
ncbi:HD domain-containing protein [Halorubrum tebenquichense]|uniref:Metal dependent phosphohydrolase n=1 Tax=Halorubrum tebenquichense DSM 14210 TaxID=1227485 RepID=M0E0F1_9EURY|nr:HD domain-containing protein [Halorubrum tebenquichense]ELZ40427.1 metal dependent phosphohydrolase [Halorubrum tebenquichense DSM 14210]